MPPTSPPRRLAPMLPALLLCLASCGHDSPLLLHPPPAPVIPPLPAQARQPAPIPECSPTCSAALTSERASWLRMLTPPESPERPASGRMTR